jgi:hypothetical protein
MSMLDWLYVPLDRLQERMESRGLETPIARRFRLYSDEHWFLGSLIFVTPTTALWTAVLYLAGQGRLGTGVVVWFAALSFVIANAFMMSYYRWRKTQRR